MFIRPADFFALQFNDLEYSGISYVPAKDGSVDVVATDNKPVPLPPYLTMQIDDLLASGISLEAANPHILGNSDLSEVAAAEKILTLVNDSKTTETAPTEPKPTEPASTEPASTDSL